MAAIEQYIERIADKDLREQLRLEVERLTKKKRFGLVWENHLPDNVILPEVSIRRGTKVALKDKTPNDVYEVQSLSDKKACCINLTTMEQKTFKLCDLIAVAQRNDVIYPYLKQMDSVQNAPDSELWHTLIEADNYHALQLLTYLYAGQVDCIYIDPPYNKPDSHDWKYNCDYVDGTDSYRHSKWLSMIEARLKIAKKLLNPNDSVLIITIDELEYHHLGCLLEQLFPEANTQMISSCINYTATARKNQFDRVNEFIYIVMFGDCHIFPQDESKNFKQNDEVNWRTLRRQNASNIRDIQHPNQFFPIYISTETNTIVEIGECLPFGVPINTVKNKTGCETVFPIKDNGTEMMWGLKRATFIDRWKKGYVKVGKHTPDKPQKYVLTFLEEGMIEGIQNGDVVITGKRPDGSVIAVYNTQRKIMPKSQWTFKSHDAREYGTYLLDRTIGEKRFPYPKSLYAVHDVLKLFVDEKPNSLILDFFAGSGTTLHAVNLLNTEDGGNRRCIMVTNNEIGEPKEKELSLLNIHPGDEEWERWGIARYVNWPRTKASILGIDVNGKPIEDIYNTTLSTTKETDRKFYQINFLPTDATLKQKKSLVTLINKQKGIKLPKLTQETDFLLSEDEEYNTTILFNIDKKEDWLDSLVGCNHITHFYIVVESDTIYKNLKKDVCDLLGKIKETIPVVYPMKDGFKTNAVFFKLGFLDKRNVERGKQLQELLPLLWMKAGAKGQCPITVKDDYMIWEKNHMALLKDEMHFRSFAKDLKRYPEVETIYLITDSRNAYLSMTEELKGYKTIQLYRDYLENFRINYAVK